MIAQLKSYHSFGIISLNIDWFLTYFLDGNFLSWAWFHIIYDLPLSAPLMTKIIIIRYGGAWDYGQLLLTDPVGNKISFPRVMILFFLSVAIPD